MHRATVPHLEEPGAARQRRYPGLAAAADVVATLLNYARSYAPQVQNVVRLMNNAPQGCVQTHGLSRGRIAAFQYHGGMNLRQQTPRARCDWLLVDLNAWPAPPGIAKTSDWAEVAIVPRPTDKTTSLCCCARRAQARNKPGQLPIGDRGSPMGATAPHCAENQLLPFAIENTTNAHLSAAQGLPAQPLNQRMTTPHPHLTDQSADLPSIARHAATVLAGQLAVMAFGVTDTLVAGRDGEASLAALSVGSAIFISIYVGLMGVFAGADARVGPATGCG